MDAAGRAGDETIRPTPEGDGAAPGLEGLPRMDAAMLEELLPALLDAVVGGPLVLTRGGRDALVLLPLDAYRRLWRMVPRPPVIDGEAVAAATTGG